jgi:hypothetical protein
MEHSETKSGLMLGSSSRQIYGAFGNKIWTDAGKFQWQIYGAFGNKIWTDAGKF